MTFARAKVKFDERKDLYNHSFRLARDEANIMTENRFRSVYFLLNHEISMNLFEAHMELLDSCKTSIGNQLRAITTARKMAMPVDELFQSAFVRFLISDKVDEFSQIGDELTDVGSMKVLLTNLFVLWE